MQVRMRFGYDAPQSCDDIDDCILDNRDEPVIRVGGEPITTYYDVEWYYYVKHIIDPARSLVRPILELLKDTDRKLWPTCDFLHQIAYDLGLQRRDRQPVPRNSVIAFHTIFPHGTEDILSDSYIKFYDFKPKHSGFARVLNNPFFYDDKSASERRLVPICEDRGIAFALDRTKVVPSAETLATEIALLNHGFDDEKAVDPVKAKLTEGIAAVLSDWGLGEAGE